MRRLLLPIAGIGLMAAAPQASRAPMSAKERTYTITLICYSISANDDDQAGNAKSLDAARKMARALRYSDERLSRDLFTMASVVGLQLRDEPDTVARNRGICRQLGLLS